MSTGSANRLSLSAEVVEIGVLRFTPAGLPALDLRLAHESSREEAGLKRQVKVSMKAIAFGATAERLARQTLGSRWCFEGFLASPGNARHPVLHIQDFQQD